MVVSRTDLLNPVSIDIRNKLSQLYKVDPERFFVRNMGVPLDTFKRISNAREQLGLPHDAKVLVFVGNLIHRKAPDFFVRLVSSLRQLNPTLKGYLIGEGPMRDELSLLIGKLDLEKDCFLIGRLVHKDIPPWLSAADCCVFPSREEPLGLVTLEAMACGTPIVASAVGGIPEIVRHGENGLLFPSDDLDAAVSCVQRVFTESLLTREMIGNGHRTAAGNSLESIAQDFFERYVALSTECKSGQA